MPLWQIGAEWERVKRGKRIVFSNILVQKGKKCSYKLSMEEKKFYIFFNGEAQGPFSERGLEMLCSQKRITGVTLVCSDDDQNWIPYSEFLKNRPIKVEEKPVPISPTSTLKTVEKPEPKKFFKIETGIDEGKIPFSSFTIAAFSVVGAIIVIFSILLSVGFLLIANPLLLPLPERLIISLGIFVSGSMSGGVLIALASIMQCQLKSVDLLNKLLEQIKK